MLIVVNFHYIRTEESSQNPGIHAVSPERFLRIVEELASHFDMIHPRELVGGVLCETSVAKCLITFDDGLREQYELAKPVLDSLNIPSLFFVNGLNFVEHRVSYVHKLHWVMSQTPKEDFISFVETELERHCPAPANCLGYFNTSSAQNAYDCPKIRRIKMLLNHALPATTRHLIIDAAYNATATNERKHAESLYMTRAQLKHLGSQHLLGSHGYYHENMAQAPKTKLERNLRLNQEAINQMCGEKTPFLSFPYGGRSAVSLAAAEVASDCGHSVCFTMERHLNCQTASPLLYGRLDANDVPGGRKPLINFQNGNVSIADEFCSYSTRWFTRSAMQKKLEGT